MQAIFGIFDILGFRDFCHDCSEKDAVEVFAIIDKFETEIPDLAIRALDVKGGCDPAALKQIKERLKWLTFSDTFFVSLSIDEKDLPATLQFNLLTFYLIVTYLNRRMFELGLPLRGAIHVGEVYQSQKCFAGGAVIKAFDLAGEIKAAVCVLTNEVKNLYLSAFQPGRPIHELVSEMFIDCEILKASSKDSLLAVSSSSYLTLCWFSIKYGNILPFGMPKDAHGFLKAAFSAFGKRIEKNEVAEKMFNTEKIFQRWHLAVGDNVREFRLLPAVIKK